MKPLATHILSLALAAAIMAAPGHAQNSKDRKGAATGTAGKGADRIAREVRHELVMLPYYGVFDNLAFQVNGSTVTLLGQVTKPTLKSDAGNVVKSIEGVERVENQIQVLPLSSMDDGIRMATYRAIYGQAGLDRYGLQAVPPIHIIVENGKVTLKGVVANSMDKQVAETKVRTNVKAFAVINDMQIEELG